MADSRLSVLTELASGAVDADADWIYIDDVSVTTSKKVLPSSIAVSIAASQAQVDAGTVTNRLITPALCKISLLTEQASTSGTSIDFTGIPAGTRRITIMLKGVSTSGTSDLLFQLGDSGGFEVTGYLGAGAFLDQGSTVGAVNYTTGFGIYNVTAASIFHGSIALSLENSSSFTWVANGMLARSDAAGLKVVAGSKPLSAELTQVRLTTAGGTDTFDAGSVNISYER